MSKALSDRGERPLSAVRDGVDNHVMGDVQRWRRNLRSELDGAAIYRAMASIEGDQPVADLYARLAVAEARHARVWAKKLRGADAWRGLPGLSLRAAALIAVARRFGPDVVGHAITAREDTERVGYEAQTDPASAELVEDEQLHARLLGRIAAAKVGGPGMARVGNALRAAVLGVNDGTVSNTSLIFGIAGAGGDSRSIVVAGFAGIIAGSLSMALGEWLSVQSSRELYQRLAKLQRASGPQTPEEDAAEIALIAQIYVSKGMAADEAHLVAEQLVRGSLGAAIERSAKEADEVADFGGSAWIAALTSWGTFAVGATAPLLPFAFLSGQAALVAAGLVGGSVLFLTGAGATAVTGRPILRSGLRSLAIGVVAATVTFSLGRVLGVIIG